MDRAKRLAPLALVAVLAYLAFANWKLEATEALAYVTACSAGGCADTEPAEVSRDPFKHRYAWKSGAGRIAITCRRELILLGAWTCKLEAETLPGVEGRDDMRQYPHQTERGAD